MNLPRNFGIGWSEKDGISFDFRGYSDDRRVMRRMSRRLGVKFRPVRKNWGTYYLMRQHAPNSAVRALMEAHS